MYVKAEFSRYFVVIYDGMMMRQRAFFSMIIVTKRGQAYRAANVVGRLLPAAKMARSRGIAGVAIGNCEKVGWQRVAALSARSAMSSYAQATVVYFTVHILLFHSTYISDGWRPDV